MPQWLSSLIELLQGNVPNWLFLLTVIFFAAIGPIRQLINDRVARKNEFIEGENRRKQQIIGLIESARVLSLDIDSIQQKIYQAKLPICTTYYGKEYHDAVDSYSAEFEAQAKTVESILDQLSSVDVHNGSMENLIETQLIHGKLKHIREIGQSAIISVQTAVSNVIDPDI